MGLLSYVLGGGNIGLIAKSITNHHNRLGDFKSVLAFYRSDFSSRSPDSRRFNKAKKAAELIDSNAISNYRDLAALALFVDAAPMNQGFYDVKAQFQGDLTKHFRKHGLDENLINGFNS
jgi:hypothetical protein